MNDYALTVFGYNVGKIVSSDKCLCQINMLKISSTETINIDGLKNGQIQVSKKIIFSVEKVVGSLLELSIKQLFTLDKYW